MGFGSRGGYQGEDLWGLDTIVACAKHFAGYGFTVDGKDYNTAMVDEATLRDVVLPPFKACVEAGALSFMNGFHTLNGVPATADTGLVRGILKDEWDFEGLVLSDWRSIDQLIPHGVAADKREAARIAAAADVVLLAIGEDAYESGEARSKTNLELKGLQLELLDEILSVNPNVVVVLSHGRPMVISSWAERVPAILATWQLGSQSGHAIADVVFGDYNPSGRLPMSFPRSQGQIPVYYNHLNTGRPAPEEGSLKHTAHYLDEANDPLYPFGYGLSYTEFAYSSLRVDVSGTLPDTVVEVNIEVTNTGERDGEEVVQLYINDPVASRARPVRELKRFRKVLLRQGESQTVTFRLTAEDLAFWTINRRMETEPGDFKLWAGDLQDEFRITGRP